MPNELPIPDELLSLIEKRDTDDRRKAERRVSDSADGSPETERRSGNDRRQQDRRHGE